MRRFSHFPADVKVLNKKHTNNYPKLSPTGVVLNRNGKPLTKSDNPRDWRYRW